MVRSRDDLESQKPLGSQRLRRILVLGGAGAGKSTVARALGQRLGCPVIHLDTIMYGPGWAPAPAAQFRGQLERLVREPAWTIEGTFPELFDMLLPVADQVIWLEQPWAIRLWRSWRKTRVNRGRARADRPDGADEVFGLTYIRTILSFGRFTPKVARALAELAPDTPVLRLKGDAEVRRFLAQAGAS